MSVSLISAFFVPSAEFDEDGCQSGYWNSHLEALLTKKKKKKVDEIKRLQDANQI